MHLKIVSSNLQYGGLMDSDGRPETRWSDLLSMIHAVRPHIVFGQEAHGYDDPAMHQMAEEHLGMRVLVAPSPSGAHTLIAYRQDTLNLRRVSQTDEWETKYAHETHHGFGVAVLEITADPSVAVPLTVISAHLNPYSAQAAAIEAQLLVARLHRYGGVGVLGGDINHLAAHDPEPNWPAMQPYNRSSRCLLPPRSRHLRRLALLLGRQWRGNRVVGRTLDSGGLIDAAALMANTTRRRALLGNTGRHMRVDQFWVTQNLADAVADYHQIPTQGASDHNIIVLTLDTAMLHKLTHRKWT